MKVKQAIKKVSAVAGGAFLLGATVTGALAYDLSDYPAPFVEGGVFAGKIVVGGQAMAADAIAATSIVAGLQPTGVVTPGPITIEGGEVFERDLNSPIAVGRALDYRDLAGFQDRSIRWDGRDVRIRDQLVISDDVMVTTNAAPGADEDFGRDAYLTVDDDAALNYTYVFRDNVRAETAGSLNTLTERPITINFLGNELRIKDATVSGGEVTSLVVEAARERFVEAGESIQVDGHTVQLRRVGESSVIVSVDGQEKVISSDDSTEFDQADYFQVAVDSIFYEAGAGDNGAVLRFGSELTHTIEPGQPMEIFGEPSELAEAEWVWGAIGSEDVSGEVYLRSISAVSNMPRTLLEADSVYERSALAQGERLYLPNSYATVSFDGYTDVRGEDISMSFDRIRAFDDPDNRVSLLERQYALSIKAASGDDVFLIDGVAVRSSEVYIMGFNSTGGFNVSYRDSGDIVLHDNGNELSSLALRLRGTGADDVVISGADGTAGRFDLTFEFPNAEELVFDVSLGTGADAGQPRHFGADNSGADGTDLVYNGTSIGTQDYGMKLYYGTEFNAPETQLDRSNPTFSMWVPYEQQQARLLVAGRGVTTTAPGGYAGATVPADVVITDAEAANMLGTQPLIIVGGPYVNTIASTLLGNPTNDEIEEMFQTGRAKIRLFGDEQALLVAGYTATDTRGAGLVLGSYRDYADQLTGMEVEVTVPNLQNVQVTPVN